MAISINNSSASLNNLKNLNNATKDLNNVNERLASGKRIVRPSDDPAGAAIASKLLNEADLSSVAARNISDGVSMANIADSALQTGSDITTRLSELATQAANGTLSDSQRQALNQEYQSLKTELDRVGNTTEFNGQQLLSGSGAEVKIQAGTDQTSQSNITVSTIGVSSQSLGLANTDLTSQANAQAALTASKNATQAISDSRGELGSSVSRLETAYSNLKTSELNKREAEDRISSADVAAEVANRVRSSVLQQADVGLQAQLNKTNGDLVQRLIT